MMTQAEFEALLQRYLDGNSQPGERQLVEKWSQQLGQEENLVLDRSLHEEVRTAMWQRIMQLTADEELVAPVQEMPVVSRPLSFWQGQASRWAAAAILVLSLGLGWWLLQRSQRAADLASAKWVRQVNNLEREQELTLHDGSRVTLYPGSRLQYKEGLAGARREVYLTGQAFFKVTKNPSRPFLVYTDKVLTTVLGTSFLVTAYANQEARVAVREGRVAVQPRKGAQLDATPAQPSFKGVVLLPNQQAVYLARNERLDKELVAKPTPLTPQPLDFKKRPVAEVLAALERVYGVNIVYDPIKLRDCTITIAFENEPLFEQLDILCKALNASYKRADDAQIIFESTGCKQPAKS
ncbi:FecR family protein [Hymenobacter sp. GOD-10R]|uniref:FecR family protein n=1 Tax=Hymenobacter sp. GOD-10R TaxID=3093922 RepID=UPI002D779A12|nr:FecR domain-containing protein [Hymenobacter sp. GOD-10R]WRQ29533.1 FecR domain-containing protein [Hymenobacter sp. GOD-10R]